MGVNAICYNRAMSFQASDGAKKPFWKKSWGKVLIVLGVIFLILLIIWSVMVFSFTKRILAGEDLSHYAGEDSFTQTDAYERAAQSAVALVDVESSDDPSLGDDDAPIVVVEFLDFECPFCAAEFPIIREMVTKYPDQIKYIVRDFPLEDLHPGATLAAQASECAHEQNRYWAYHDKLFQNQQEFTQEVLVDLASQVGLEVQDFQQCLEQERYLAEVLEDFQDGIDAGALGTPTFFVNGYKLQGVVPQDAWEKIVQLDTGLQE